MARFSKRSLITPDVELAGYDLTGSPDPVQDAYRIASSIQRTPMPLSGPLFKFALMQSRLMQSRADEFYLFVCCHHIAIDGIGVGIRRADSSSYFWIFEQSDRLRVGIRSFRRLPR
jgi:hypothetical protein